MAGMSGPIRFAAYWAPERTDRLWTAGCEWLGRDPERGIAVASERPGARAAWRYGFHATLKAPMALAGGAVERDFFGAVERLAARTTRFVMPRLEVSTLRDFIALVPEHPVAAEHPLRRLADACVSELDVLRQAPTEKELQRRVQSNALDSTATELLHRWGYPHVFERWRFHMTLSDSMKVDGAGRALHDQMRLEAQRHFAEALAEPVVCASISVFAEPSPGEPVVLTRRFALAAP
jgi:hypothetical protein